MGSSNRLGRMVFFLIPLGRLCCSGGPTGYSFEHVSSNKALRYRRGPRSGSKPSRF